MKTVCIVGGTGFLGRHLVAELARRGHRIRVLTRRRERDRQLLVFPTLELMEGDIHDSPKLCDLMADCDVAFNLAGILNQRNRPGTSFEDVHSLLPGKVAEACRYNKISRLIHVSALGAAKDAPSQYLRSKAEGEANAHAWSARGVAVTSFRPSVMFGPDDDFFNRFAELLKRSPCVMPLACPGAVFAPVYVCDVARVLVDAIDDKSTYDKRYELCGPSRYNLRELVDYTARVSGHEPCVVNLSDSLSKLLARIMGVLPDPPFSIDNYLSMQVENVCQENGFVAFGVEPTSIESVVPSYLGKRHRQARYNKFRSSAGR